MKKIFLLVMMLFSAQIFYANAESTASIYIYGDHEYRRNGLIPFTSQEDVVLHTVGNNIRSSEMTVEVYRSNKEDLLQYLVYGEKGNQVNTRPRIDENEKIVEMAVKKGEHFTLDIDDHGIFVLKVSADDVVAYAFVVRSENGAIIKEEKDSLLVWVQSFEDGKRVDGARLKAYSLRGFVDKREDIITNGDGIAHMSTSAKYDVITVEKDDDVAVIPVNLMDLNYGYENTRNEYPGQTVYSKYYTVTDRPLYKPGDTVHFKSILRYDDDLSYFIPSGGSWQVKIVTGWGDEEKVIVEDQYDIDSYGTFSGDLVLPNDVETGTLRLEITRRDQEEQQDGWYWRNSGSTVYFDVEHYRKPEYSISLKTDRREVGLEEELGFSVHGSYFSGESLSGGTITYTVYENDYWDSPYIEYLSHDNDRYEYYHYSGSEIGKGTVALNAQGYAHASFTPKRSNGEVKIYAIEAQYAQPNGEVVIDRENVLVYPSAYGIYRSLHDDLNGKKVGEEVDVKLKIHAYRSDIDLNDQKLSIVINRAWWEKIADGSSKYAKYVHKEEKVDDFTIKTDREGQAHVRFTPQAQGSYTIKIIGYDDDGNYSIRDFHIWISEKEYVASRGDSMGISIETDKEQYEPGDTVNATIKAEEGDRDVLVTQERDFVHEYDVIQLDSAIRDVDFTINDTAMPRMTLSVSGFDRSRLISDQKVIHVSVDKQKMDISIKTDKEKYEPGDTVVVDIVARDHKGKPLKADIALWTVDKALFELVLKDSSDIFDTFWGDDVRNRYTNSSNSLVGIAINAAEKGGGGDDGVRSALKDVAYWNPRIRTGDDGRAQVSFVIPDNLTTWAMTAIGTTQDTIVGQVFDEFVTTKPVIVRPYIPNILRKDDHVTVVATVQNFTNSDREFEVKLDFDGGTIIENAQRIKINKDASVVVSWDIIPEKEDFMAKMIFSATAIDDENLSDGIEQEVMIEQYGFRETDSFVHHDNGPYAFVISEDAFNDKTRVELTIAASILHSLSGSMKYLIHYPYGCIEQTTSALVPIILSKEHPEFFAEAMKGKDIDAMMAHGIERLQNNQNADGSWGWWGNDHSDVFVSAYVAENLLRAQSVGAQVDQNVLNKVKEYFARITLPTDQEMRAYDTGARESMIMYAYGRSLFADLRSDVPILITEDLSPDVISMGVMANVRNGHMDKNTNGYNILVAKLQGEGNYQFLQKGNPYYFASIDTSTALGLRALIMADGDINTIKSVIQYLITNRRKEYWSHTYATSQTVDAFTMFADLEKNDIANGDFRIMIDGKELKRGVVGAEQPLMTIAIPIDMIGDHGSEITIETDSKALYSTLFVDQFHTEKNTVPLSRDISISRSYENVKGKNYSIGVGDIVDVTLKVHGLGDDMQYLLIEDHLPAGMVPINEGFINTENDPDNEYGRASEYGKAHVVFSSRWPRNNGGIYKYRARVVSAGDFATPPANAFLMYNPEIYARTSSYVMHIEKESQVVNIDGTEKKAITFMQIFDGLRSIMNGIAIVSVVAALGIGVAVLFIKRK